MVVKSENALFEVLILQLAKFAKQNLSELDEFDNNESLLDDPKQLTKENLEDLEKQQEDQNNQLNACVKVALKRCQDMTTSLLDNEHRLKTATFNALQKRLCEAMLVEIGSSKEAIAKTQLQCQTMSITCKDVKHTEQKVDLLTEAGATLNEATEIIQTSEAMLKRAEA